MPCDEELAIRARDLVTRLTLESRTHAFLPDSMGRPVGDDAGSKVRDAEQGGPAEDADTVMSLLERLTPPRARGPVFVGLVGALVMFATMSAVVTLAMAFSLPALVTLPFILGGPLLGWLLTLPEGRR